MAEARRVTPDKKIAVLKELKLLFQTTRELLVSISVDCETLKNDCMLFSMRHPASSSELLWPTSRESNKKPEFLSNKHETNESNDELRKTVVCLNEMAPDSVLDTNESDELNSHVRLPTDITVAEAIVLLANRKETPLIVTPPSSDKVPVLNVDLSILMVMPDVRLIVVELKPQPKMEIDRRLSPKIVSATLDRQLRNTMDVQFALNRSGELTLVGEL
jgi:hypothetical protein